MTYTTLYWPLLHNLLKQGEEDDVGSRNQRRIRKGARDWSEEEDFSKEDQDHVDKVEQEEDEEEEEEEEEEWMNKWVSCGAIALRSRLMTRTWLGITVQKIEKVSMTCHRWQA